jgi:hypothetical protein
MLSLLHGLEVLSFCLPRGFEIGKQVENFIFRELIQQTFRHGRDLGRPALGDLGFRDFEAIRGERSWLEDNFRIGLVNDAAGFRITIFLMIM